MVIAYCFGECRELGFEDVGVSESAARKCSKRQWPIEVVPS